jgi:hypothetical protein
VAACSEQLETPPPLIAMPSAGTDPPPVDPAIVALWFAALLGIGSLVLPAVLLERLVSASGIASLVPAAAPPLGFTARGIIAILGGLLGAALGLSVARRVVRAHSPEPVSRVAKLAGAARRPLSVRDELGGEGRVDGESLPISRRRALAISEDDRPSDYLYRAPLPGVDPAAPAPFADTPAATDEEPLELSELAIGLADEPEAAEPEDASDEDLEMNESRESPSSWPSHQHLPAGGAEPVDELDSRKNLAGPRGLEPLPFAAPSLARRAPEPEAEYEPEAEPEPQVLLEAVAEPEPDVPAFRADWQTAPLDGRGLVQLVQRLGSTIERRRELMARPAPAPVERFAAAPVDFEPAPAEEAAQAMAAFFAPGSAPAADEPEAPGIDRTFDADPAEGMAAPTPAEMPRPEILNPVALEDEDDEAVPDFSLPLRRSAAAATPSLAEVGQEAGDEEETSDGEDGYSSLLGMSNPFTAPKTEFVRIEEPVDEPGSVEPAVVFPGQEEPARPAEPAPELSASTRLFDPPGKGAAPAPAGAQPPADTDAALRAALATLQRMSGAA